MSAITRLGWVSLIAIRAPHTVSVSAHTSRASSRAMICRNPARTIGWLSTIRMRAVCGTLLVCRQQFIDFLRGNRRAVKVALRLIAIQSPQQLELFRGLDAFGHRQQAEG